MRNHDQKLILSYSTIQSGTKIMENRKTFCISINNSTKDNIFAIKFIFHHNITYRMEYLNWGTLQLPLATALGTMSIYPKKPLLFIELSKYVLFQWLLVFVYIWQGGARQNWQLALVATIVLYIVVQALDMWYVTRENDIM